MSLALRLAVVTGGHPFDVPSFQQVFRAMPTVDFYPQALDEFCAAPQTAAEYDVVLFYTMHQFKPGDELPWYQKRVFSTLEQLGREKQGIVVLHHALYAFDQWPLWSELTGLAERNAEVEFGQEVRCNVKPNHAITEGVPSWTLKDEIYITPDAGPDSEILIETDHPRSMKTLAWTRQFRGSRVFCYQSGHDASAFNDANFRRILERGILWAGRRL